MKIGFCMNKYIQINRYLSKYICVCIDKDRILYESYPNILPKKANNYSIGDPASLYKSLLMFYQASNLPHLASPKEVSSGIHKILVMSGEMARKFSNCICLVSPTQQLASPTEVSSGIHKKLGLSVKPLPPLTLLPPQKCPAGFTKRLGMSGEPLPTPHFASPTEVSSGIHRRLGML